ncbi:TolC family protein [Anaerophaga thermohalophila]|jgi:outer membrane protein TolC|uniref:TolC family protein n=1 Tax=Anaerophaga thermohalophila TaxID=177400 RepID=UPI0002D672EE|nr:TolC family protein [Anaerophaga thermohalophila]
MLQKTIYLALIVLIAVPGFSQTPITIEECRQEALANNKDIQSSVLELQKAEASVKEARTGFLPAIDGSANAMYIPNLEELKQFGIEKEDLEVYQAQFSAQQPIYAGGKVRLSNKMAKKRVDIADKAREQQRAEIIMKTDEAYWDLVAMQEQKKVVEKFTEALDSLEEQLQANYEQGLVPKSELLKVTVQKNEAEVTAMEVKNAVQLLQMNLARIIGRNLDEPLRAISEPDFPVDNDEPTFSQEPVVPGNRPEIQIMENQVDMAQMETKMTRADYLPELGAQVSYGYLKVPDISDGSWQLNAAVQLSIPIIHWREKKHKMKKAEISEQMTKLDLQNAREQISLEIRKTWLKLQEGIEKIQLARKNLEEATESLSEVEISYNAGLNTITDLLNARVARQRADASLIEAQSNYQVLKSSWLKAIGKLDKKYQ